MPDGAFLQSGRVFNTCVGMIQWSSTSVGPYKGRRKIKPALHFLVGVRMEHRGHRWRTERLVYSNGMCLGVIQ